MATRVRTGVRALALAFFGLSAAVCSGASAQVKPYPAPASLDAFRIADRAEEVALARTAAPAELTKDAEILTLGAHGYETAVKGANGFICMVDRAWMKPFDDPEFWNPKMRAPTCYNPAAVRSVVPIILERARWVTGGASKEQIHDRTVAAVAAHTMPRPENGAMAYMMSKQQYLSDEGTPHWHSHVMFLYPLGKAADFGAGRPETPVAQADDETLALRTVFVLVPRWSDGTASPMHME